MWLCIMIMQWNKFFSLLHIIKINILYLFSSWYRQAVCILSYIMFKINLKCVRIPDDEIHVRYTSRCAKVTCSYCYYAAHYFAAIFTFLIITQSDINYAVPRFHSTDGCEKIPSRNACRPFDLSRITQWFFIYFLCVLTWTCHFTTKSFNYWRI